MSEIHEALHLAVATIFESVATSMEKGGDLKVTCSEVAELLRELAETARLKATENKRSHDDSNVSQTSEHGA